MSKPLVSIIMPTYNRGIKISESIKSVINQTYTNWELIIVDDKSTDNTKKIIIDLSNSDNRIKYYFNSGKKGVSAARNYGIKAANGKYLAFLDSDDLWINHHLMNSISVLEKYNKKVSFALWYEIVNGIKTPIDKLDKKMFENGYEKHKDKIVDDILIFSNKDFYENLLLENFYCYHINTLVLDSSIITKNLMFDENLITNGDADFTFRIIMNYGFCLIKDYHFEYYFCDDNLYAFMDRRKLNLNKIIKNTAIINKITSHGKYKVIHYKKRKKFIKKSKLVQNKKDWIDYFNHRIAKKLFTIGFLYNKINRVKGFYYCIKSLFFCFNKKTFKFIFKPSKNMQSNNTLFDFS